MAKLTETSKVLMCCVALLSSSVFALPDIQVQGLLPNQAVVTIDGKQHILKIGKPTPEGVNLISADSKKAVMEWNGERIERTLTREITSNFSPPVVKDEVRITRGHNNHFLTPGQINGRQVSFMVDTGAFTIAMTPAEADRLGLNWRKGERFVAGTAGGGTPGYKVMLNTVSVGDITLHNIEGAVIVAESDSDILLGETFLSQTEMHEENNTLVLRKKY